MQIVKIDIMQQLYGGYETWVNADRHPVFRYKSSSGMQKAGRNQASLALSTLDLL
jgi:hypothetical protein